MHLIDNFNRKITLQSCLLCVRVSKLQFQVLAKYGPKHMVNATITNKKPFDRLQSVCKVAHVWCLNYSELINICVP